MENSILRCAFWVFRVRSVCRLVLKPPNQIQSPKLAGECLGTLVPTVNRPLATNILIFAFLKFLSTMAHNVLHRSFFPSRNPKYCSPLFESRYHYTVLKTSIPPKIFQNWPHSLFVILFPTFGANPLEYPLEQVDIRTMRFEHRFKCQYQSIFLLK